MGWFDSDYPGHEGHAVAFVERERTSSGLLRELAYPDDSSPRADILEAAAACECGWRSPRFLPRASGEKPEWHPFAVFLSEADDERVRALWRRHLTADAQRFSGRVSDGR